MAAQSRLLRHPRRSRPPHADDGCTGRLGERDVTPKALPGS